MEVGLTMTMDRKNGTLELAVAQCGCYMENLVITLDGGASWFYQGYMVHSLRASIFKFNYVYYNDFCLKMLACSNIERDELYIYFVRIA